MTEKIRFRDGRTFSITYVRVDRLTTFEKQAKTIARWVCPKGSCSCQKK